MNLLLNPGFDNSDGFEYWTPSVTGAALDTGRTGQGVALAAYRDINQIGPPPVYLEIEGTVWQTVTVEAGRSYVASVWVKSTLAWGPIVLLFGDTEAARLETATVGEWTLLVGVFDATVSGPISFVIKAPLGAEATGVGQWVVDDCEVVDLAEELMSRTSYQAYKALFDAYRTVDGSGAGFWNDLGGRVFPKLIYPDQLGGNALPYACVVLSDEQAPYDFHDRLVIDTIRVRCAIFVAGNERSMDPDSSTVRSVLNAYEDHKRLFLAASVAGSAVTSSGAVQDATIVDKSNRAGTPDGIDWGESWITVDLMYAQDYADLGPGGA